MTLRFLSLLALLAAALLVSAACSSAESDTDGAEHRVAEAAFPDGDATRGFAAFERLHCTSCHQVAGYDFPGAQPSLRPPMVLAEGVREPLSRSAIRTAIVSPSHSLAPEFDQTRIETGDVSIMPDYGHVMTVRELADLVAFLGEAYSAAADG